MMKKWVLLFCLCLVPLAASAFGPGDTAPDFTKTQLASGKKFHLADLKGKVVLVNFWATWCGPCRMEIPGFVDLVTQYRKKGLAIVGVSIDRKPEGEVKDFLGKAHINYPVVMDPDGELANQYGGFEYIPVSFLIGKDGKVLKVYPGASGKERFEQDIRQALGS
jgi:peroxiredoxin